MDNDMELYLEINDEFKHIQPFDIDTEYPYHNDDLTNKVCVSVSDDTGTIAYLECFIFYDDRIAESQYDHTFLADEISQDAYDAMALLKKLKLLIPTENNKTIGELLTSYPGVTVYLYHIAARDDYRLKGNGSWLLRNLPKILQRN